MVTVRVVTVLAAVHSPVTIISSPAAGAWVVVVLRYREGAVDEVP